MISPFYKNKIRKDVPLRKVVSITVLTLGVFILSTHFANAQGVISSLLGFGTVWQTIAEVLAAMSNVALSLTSWFVALTATLLNVSINITMHIKDIVSSTPAIYDIWKIIRDLSGLVIIFTLLIASIQLILGVGSPNFGNLIKNVVIAGVLINFSFFMTGVLIDASNMVSLTLYRAMVPGQPDIGEILSRQGHTADGQAIAQSQEIVQKLLNDGGISALFMQSLQLQSQFNPKNINMKDSTGGISAALKIVLIAVTGIVIMVTAGLSFLAASLAFIVRLVILIFLLAFSPIWFAAAVIPQLSEYSKDWWGALKSQLLFMPVYLLLMYVALMILSKSSVFTNGAAGNLWKGGATGAAVPTEFIVLAINSVFVIIMLNVPLLAAIKIGGMATKFLDKMPIKAGNIWKKAGGTMYQGTISRGASAIGRSETLKDLASKSRTMGLALKGVRGVAENYDKKLATQVKSRTEFAESLGYDQQRMNQAQSTLRSFQSQLASAKARNANQNVIDHLEAQVGISKGAVSAVENARKQNMATSIDNPSIDTLYSKIARKDRVAAAKIQIPIFEKQLTHRKESLKEVRDDITQLSKTIKNNPAGPGVAAGTATAAQAAELTRLQHEEVNKLQRVNDTEREIDDLKLIK